jgi:hypothetical protein
MECHNQQLLRDELIELHSKQLDTLEREIFGALTTTEWREYEERRDRICQLYDELFILMIAA